MYKVTVPVFFLQKTYKRNATIAELKRMGAERVALIMMRNLQYRFSPPEELELLRQEIKVYQDAGFETMVWLGESFGHDPEPPKPGVAYKTMRFFDKGDISPLCPLDEKFRDALCDWIKDIAGCGAQMIMLDDDFRLGHRPGGLGCCCDLHMARLKEELQEEFTEQEFKRLAFDGGENKYRNAWIKVCGDTMREISSALRQAVNCVNPAVQLGFCVTPSHWDSEGADAVEIAKTLAGDTKPFMRISGAPYWCDTRTTVGEVVEYARAQAAFCKNQGVEIFSEGDTYPRPRFTTPAAYLECFDTILRAAQETDGILKYVLDYVSSADYEHGYVDFHEQNKPLYAEIERLFSGKKAVGVRPYNEQRLLQTRELDVSCEDALLKIQNNLSNPAKSVAVKASLPISYDDGAALILFGEHAKFIPESMLKNGAIIDLSAAEQLTARGIDVGVERVSSKEDYVKMGFMDWPFEYYPAENEYTLLEYLPRFLVEYKAGVQVVTRLNEGAAWYDGVGQYENEKGQRFVILPVRGDDIPRGVLDTYARRRQLVKSLQWLTGKPLKVDVCGNYPMAYLLEKENETSVALGVWNLYQDKIDNLTMTINVPFESVRFVHCSGRVDKNKIVLDGTLYPYEFAAVEVLLK